jgi:hypothetical protein
MTSARPPGGGGESSISSMTAAFFLPLRAGAAFFATVVDARFFTADALGAFGATALLAAADFFARFAVLRFLIAIHNRVPTRGAYHSSM